MVQIAIEVLATPTNAVTTPKDQTPEIDVPAPSFEEGASIECNLSGIADEPYEDREPSDEAESITNGRETAPVEESLPTITIDRRSRTLPTFGVNGIATINYIDNAPPDKDSDSANLLSITKEEATKCQETTQKESIDEQKEDNDIVATSPKQTIASSLLGSKSKYVVKIVQARTNGKPRSSNKEVNETALAPYPVEIAGKGTKSTDMDSVVAAPSQVEEGGVEYEGITEQQTAEKSEEGFTFTDAESETKESKDEECMNAGSETKTIKNDVSALEPPMAPLPEDSVKMEDAPAQEADTVSKKNDESSSKVADVEEEPVVEPSAPVESVQPAPSLSKIYDAITTSNNDALEENAEQQQEEEEMDDESVEVLIEVSKSIVGEQTDRTVSKSRGRAFTIKAMAKSTAAASSRRLSSTSKSLAASSKSTAAASSRRLSSTSKSLAASSKSLIDNVRARSRSRGRISARSHELTNKDSDECVPFDQTAANDLQLSVEDEKEVNSVDEKKPVVNEKESTSSSSDKKLVPSRSDVESMATRIWRLGEAIVSPKASTANKVNEFKEIREPEKEESNVEEAVTENTEANAATNPVAAIKSPANQGGFMSRFFSRMSDDLFCKTDLDYSNFCGGVANVASPIAVNTGVTLQTIQRAIASPAFVNAVEVKPIFDEDEPADAEPDTAGGEEAKPMSKSTDDHKRPVKPIDAMSTSIETTPSIDLQDSSLRSTKSNTSLRLITEVQSQPSTESMQDTPTAPSTVPDAIDTTAINTVVSPVASMQPRTLKNLQVDTSFLKKQEQSQTDNSAKKGSSRGHQIIRWQ